MTYNSKTRGLTLNLAHHWVYETSKILHRDISVSNIMFSRKRGDSRRIRGVLCDWDLAYDLESPYPPEQKTLRANPDIQSDVKEDQIIIEKHDKDHIGPCYRTGTGPFMALDLLEEGTVPFHLYRHDLESFFFVLVWFCAVFDPDTRTFGHLKNWESSDLVSIGLNKRNFIHNETTQEKVFAKAATEYKPLITTWIGALLDTFELVHIDQAKLKRFAKEKKRAEEQGQVEEGRRCAEEIDHIHRSKNERITYDKFMKCLGIEVTNE